MIFSLRVLINVNSLSEFTYNIKFLRTTVLLKRIDTNVSLVMFHIESESYDISIRFNVNDENIKHLKLQSKHFIFDFFPFFKCEKKLKNFCGK